jgi:hypothetical protein
MKAMPHWTAVILSVGLIATNLSADVLLVPGQFSTIQSAVDAASNLDVILVTPGTYNEGVLISDKAVSLVADGGSVNIGYLVVQNLSPFRDVVLRGLTVLQGPFLLPAAHMLDNLGAVRIEQCDFTGGNGQQPLAKTGKPGLWVEDCASVNIASTTLTGGHGASLIEEDTDGPPGDGGPGLLVRDSLLTLTDCVLTGGHGGDIYDTVWYEGGGGGRALQNIASQVMLGGSSLTGGDGGMADCTFQLCGIGGEGGGALHQQQPGASTWLRDNTLSNGTPGINGDGQGIGFNASLLWIEAGSLFYPDAPWRSMSADSPVRENTVANVNISGEAGDQAFLWASLGSMHLPLIGKQGVFLLGLPALLQHVPIGTIPLGGSLPVPLAIPELGPGIEAVNVHLQLVILDGSSALIGPLSTLTLLDSAF